MQICRWQLRQCSPSCWSHNFGSNEDELQNSEDKQGRMMLLTLSPKFWSRDEITEEFGCTEREARKARELMNEGGVLVLPDATVKSVKNLYNRDDVSRLMPGMSDYVSVKTKDGKREHVQKRLLLCNLYELHAQYTQEYPDIKICLTKFTQLCPAQCILAGSSGTHNVCVCVHHENVEIMLEAIEIQDPTSNTQLALRTYQDYLRIMVCNSPSSACFLGDCLNCPESNRNRAFLREKFEGNDGDQMKFETWTHAARCPIVTQMMYRYVFIDSLSDRLMKFKTHDFIAKKQSASIKELKLHLSTRRFIVCFDFTGNYAFVVQNPAQSFHWNNNQAIIFTVVLHFIENGELKHESFAIIFDDSKHNTFAVHQYQKIIIEYPKQHFELITKIIYVSDGAGQHFKDKSNLGIILKHEEDFGTLAKRHHHATAHGKGGCDGISSAHLKRGAKRASLQRTSQNQILTAQALYEWAKVYSEETDVFFSPTEDYEEVKQVLQSRFGDAKVVPGTP
ncbi:hypothetical protein QAD02_020608 [Eretmocerus hayati]|uniref:Uncharacterized protein n=1 Tax=Eretmocerus hayati TaxID=131215 RepID=A0ACC2PN05_9HYME|nr:hypothetical protein QAD02_020608 [Eretmocerus hayati]